MQTYQNDIIIIVGFHQGPFPSLVFLGIQSDQSPRSPELRKVLGGNISRKKNAMCDLRGKIQGKVDDLNDS